MTTELERQIRGLRHGDHCCLIYERAAEQTAVIVPFLKQGLARNECCISIADNPTVEEVAGVLATRGVDVSHERERGALLLLTSQDTYLRAGAFDPADMIDFLRQKMLKALAAGFSGLRVTGDMTWALGPESGCDRPIEYEALLNRFVSNNPVLAICQYNRLRFAPDGIHQVLRTHPVVILGDQACPNPYYERPEMILGQMSLSEQVDWKIAQLRRARATEQTLQESHALLRAVVEGITDAVFVKDQQGRYLMVNSAGASLVGKSVEEVLGKDDTELFTPETARPIMEGDRRILSTGETLTEERDATAAGVTRTYVATKGPYRGPDGNVVGVIGIAHDITARKKLEVERDRLLERLRLQIDRLPLAYVLHDTDNRVLDWNPAAEKMFGYTREEVLGRDSLDLILPLPVDSHVREILRRVQAGDMHADSVNENRTKDGRIITCEWFNTPLTEAGDTFAGAISVVQDITERKRTEEALQESLVRIRLLLDSTAEAIYGLDLDGRCTFCNPACLRLLGYADTRDLLGISMHRLVHHTRADGTSYPLEECGIFRAYRRGEGAHVEDEVLWRADGTGFPVEYWSHPVRREGVVVGAVVTFVDISERRRAEEELGTLNAALENAVEGIALMDPQGRYLSVNRAYAGMLGYQPEELVGMDWWLIVHPKDLEKEKAAHQRMGSEGRAEVEVLGVRKDHSVFWKQVVLVRAHDHEGQWIGHYCFMKDITDRKRAEETLSENAERLQVLARRVVEVQEAERRHLARELHDEIGQVLSAISVNLHAVKGGCDDAAWPRLDECLGIVDRAIQQVRNLSLDLRPSMLDDLGLASALRWLVDRQAQRADLVAHFTVRSSGAHLPPDLATTCFRVAQEALTNVIRHARARRVWVELYQGEKEVRLVIGDDGIGFDVDEARRRAARGASLGLLGMQERIALHGGQITIESEPGHGTSLRVWFPVTSAPSSEDRGSEGKR